MRQRKKNSSISAQLIAGYFTNCWNNIDKNKKNNKNATKKEKKDMMNMNLQYFAEPTIPANGATPEINYNLSESWVIISSTIGDEHWKVNIIRKE